MSFFQKTSPLKGLRGPTAGSPVMPRWDATRGCATSGASGASALGWGGPAPPRGAPARRRCPRLQGAEDVPSLPGHRWGSGAKAARRRRGRP